MRSANSGRRRSEVAPPAGWKVWICACAMAALALIEGVCRAATDFLPTDDTYVDQSAPATTQGANTVLRVRSGATGNEQNTYLRFAITGVTGQVTSAALIVYSTNVTSNVTAYSVPDTSWTEGALTWATRPSVGPSLATVNCVSGATNQWDVTNAVTGNGPYAFCLKDSPVDSTLRFRSKENNNPAPLLRITTSADTGMGWRVIDTGYPTDDMVVAAEVLDTELPGNPATQDCSSAFMTAFAAVENLGGGFVYAPAGEYLFTNPITLPKGVHLRGAWAPITDSDRTVRGTILKCTYTGATSFITLRDRSGVQDLTIWYPNQNLSNPIHYATTIDAVAPRTDSIHLDNINLVNSWVSISPQCSLPFANVRNIYGSPLSLGIYMYDSSGLPRYSLFHFSADYWADSGLPGAPAKSALQTYLRANATAIQVGSSDNIFSAEWNIKDYNIGVHCIDNGLGTLNGNLYGLHITNCNTAMLIDALGPTFFMNSEFDGSSAGVVINQWNSQVFFNGCTFNSGTDNSFNDAHTGGYHQAGFQKCAFNKKIFVKNTDLQVVNSTFTMNAQTIILSNNTKSVILAGNTYAYGGDPAQLNGCNPALVASDPNPTYSDSYTPFDVNGYNKTRKPAAANMIVLGTAGYSVHVDGTTDDGPVIQDALNDVAALGGGIVMAPQISSLGYAIRTPINVPAGCELRASGEGMHARENQDPLTGALLQVFYGQSGATPVITLNAGSGFKGFTIHYPEQYSNNILPYSFTVKAIGNNAYITGIQFVNAYDCVEFNNSDNYFVEHCFITPIHRVFKAINCAGGRIQNIHVRGDWDDAGYGTYVGWQFTQYPLTNAIPYEFQNSTNQQIWATFSRACNWVGQFTDSTVQALMFSAESCQNGVKVIGIPAGGRVDLLGTSIRANCDIGLPQNMFNVSVDPGDGQFRAFSSLLDGPLDTVLKANNASCLLQQCWLDAGNYKVATDGFTMTGSAPSVVRIENCAFDNPYVATDIVNVDGTRLEAVGNLFREGFEFFTHQSRMQETVNPGSLLPATRLAEAGNLTLPAISAQMNLATPGSSGLTVLSTNYELQLRGYEFKQWYRSITGYHPTGSPKELIFQVDSSLFAVGQEPANATLKFYYYDWYSGQIAISYKLPGGNWTSAGSSITLTGDGGFQFNPPTEATNPYWLTGTMSVPGTLFRKGTQIKFAVTGDAIFSYLNLKSADSPNFRQMPFGGASSNNPPTFTSDPFTKANATEDAAYSGSISGDASDSDRGDTMTFSMISGPSWLSVDTSGGLSGTPTRDDVGLNASTVRVTDSGGLYDEATMNITVNPAPYPPASAAGKWVLY